MFEPRASIWDPVHAALTHPTTGVLTLFQDRVRFGFSLFRGSNTPTTPETNPACATILSVPYALDNRNAIETLYADASDDYTTSSNWQTPTANAIRRTADDLASLAFEPPGRKYILLVTDGNPNTCQVLDPECGQDSSIAATQYARSRGITLLAAGLGDILQGNSGCPASARCGTEHLQDLANAGTGLAVEAPPESYRFEQCVPNMTLSAAYATPPGTATFYSGTNETEHRVAFTAAMNAILAGTLP
jgi:hypothetical protein